MTILAGEIIHKKTQSTEWLAKPETPAVLYKDLETICFPKMAAVKCSHLITIVCKMLACWNSRKEKKTDWRSIWGLLVAKVSKYSYGIRFVAHKFRDGKCLYRILFIFKKYLSDTVRKQNGYMPTIVIVSKCTRKVHMQSLVSHKTRNET